MFGQIKENSKVLLQILEKQRIVYDIKVKSTPLFEWISINCTVWYKVSELILDDFCTFLLSWTPDTQSHLRGLCSCLKRKEKFTLSLKISTELTSIVPFHWNATLFCWKYMRETAWWWNFPVFIAEFSRWWSSKEYGCLYLPTTLTLW